MKDYQSLQISLRIHEDYIHKFGFLLQNGFTIKAVIGCSIYDFLSKQCYLKPDYIASRITTIFLNSSPVDDMKTAILEPDAKLSLSGAMPGLVGAVMRTGSFYASFRDNISFKKTLSDYQEDAGYIKLKLFNILMTEIGPFFLEKGIIINSADLRYFLKLYENDVWDYCSEVLVNHIRGNADLLINDIISNHDTVFLTAKLQK